MKNLKILSPIIHKDIDLNLVEDFRRLYKSFLQITDALIYKQKKKENKEW